MSTFENQRHVSRLTRSTLALVLAGGRGSRLRQLTLWRAKPAVPFGGKFRIIDFPLSNCLNSGIRMIGVLTQYKAHSLIQHIQQGWSFLRGEFKEFIEILPAQQRIEDSWYSGTADAVYQNLDIIRIHKPEYVLILAGDHVYKMDYGPMIAHHVETGADMTVGCIEVPLQIAKAFGVISVDTTGRVTRFDEKPDEPEPMPGSTDTALASMGIYIFNTAFLYEQLIKDADSDYSTHDQWPIWTYQEQLPPAKFIFDDDDRRGMALDSMVSGGCLISGATVRHSLLFSNVRVNSYSVLQDVVALPNVRIGRDCRVTKAVIDKGCVLPEGTVIGEDPEMDAERFYVSPNGVVLVTPEMLGQELHHVR